MASYPVQYPTAQQVGSYNPPTPGPVHQQPGDQVNHPPPGVAQQPTPQSQQQHNPEDSESSDEESGSEDDDPSSGSDEEYEEPENPAPAQPLPYPNPDTSGGPQAAFIPMPGTESRESRAQPLRTRETDASMVYDASSVHNQQQPHAMPSAGGHQALRVLDEHPPATTAQHDPEPRAQKAQTNTGGHRWPFQDDETEDPDDEAEDLEAMLSQQGDVYGPPHGMADAAHTREAGNSSAPLLRRGPRKKGLKSWWKSLWVPVPMQSDQEDHSPRQKRPRKRLTKPRPQGASSGTRGGPGGEAASYFDDNQSFATNDILATAPAHDQYPSQSGGQSSSTHAPSSGNLGEGSSTQASREHTEGPECWCLHTPRLCTRRNHPVGLHICKNQRHRA
ncbi:hypothetical protein LTR59_009654 [Friedmanniomyces endolithicus]|nr:hypothetical protein LTR94_004034 [Friedmanniomyces endolithicus]KAK0789411.1 hypothetical protein LTR59_009654 [Friedmanniomyces endolithicus]KAK0799372.1 hypothetical protein LTR38_007558 [Friedmanniomyces endolithicus]